MDKRVLFVDDDTNVLNALRRLFRNEDLEVLLAESGADGLQILEEADCDVVVSDLRMKGMDGVTFLEHVKENNPMASRLLLSGFATPKDAPDDIEGVLSKPWNESELKSAVSTAIDRCARKRDGAAWLEARFGQNPDLPEWPSFLTSVRPGGSRCESVQELVDVLTEKPDFAEIMRHSLSSYAFCGDRQADSLYNVVHLIGMDTANAACLSEGFLRSAAGTEGQASGRALLQHGLATGRVAMHLCRMAGWNARLASAALISGTLHDIGKSVRMRIEPDSFNRDVQISENTHQPLWQTERETTGHTHADIGAYFAEWLAFPAYVSDTIRHHHGIFRASSSRRTAAAVHVADILTQRFRVGSSGNGCCDPIESRALKVFNLNAKRLEVLRTVAETAL